MNKNLTIIVVAILVGAAVAGGGWYYFSQKKSPTSPEQAQPQEAVEESASEAPTAPNVALELPSDFPRELVYPGGNLVSVINNNDRGGVYVIFETSDSQAEAYTKFKKQIEDNGWKVDFTYATGQEVSSSSFNAQKGENSATVVIIVGEGKTHVTVTWATEVPEGQ